MAVLKPIVLNLPTRGACAVDYIDYFDEGQYGPDKPFFVARFDDFQQVAEQMRTCLSLQGNENSLIHFNRHHIEGKFIEPLKDPNEKYPQRAQYMIRFMLRIKFYGEFAYIDIGKRWDDTDPASAYYITANDLEVINRCMISAEDANEILETYIKGATVNGVAFKDTPAEKYELNDSTVTISPLTEGAAYEYLQEKEAEANANYIFSEDGLLSDGDTLLTFE